MSVAVTGIGWVATSGLGHGGSGKPFLMGTGDLPRLTRKDIFDEPYPRFGRFDDFSRVGLAAIAAALQDAGLDVWREKRDVGIIASTEHGCVAADAHYFDTVVPDSGLLASPNAFAFTLPSCFLGEAALRFGLTGPTLVLNEASGQFLECVRMALDMMTWKESQTMLAGICNLNTSVFGEQRTAPAGAVFIVMQQHTDLLAHVYGTIQTEQDGTILVRGVEVDGWQSLASELLKRQGISE